MKQFGGGDDISLGESNVSPTYTIAVTILIIVIVICALKKVSYLKLKQLKLCMVALDYGRNNYIKGHTSRSISPLPQRPAAPV